MASLASINVKFSADMAQFQSQMQNAQKSMEQAGKRMQKIGKQMSVAVTAPLVALAGVSLKNFDTQAKAIAQVEAGLRSTANAAGYTSEQLQKMASELQNNSLFGDEAILKDVTAQLLTFTGIANEQFSRTQQVALDLATRLDGDLKSASIQLGKALNDPVKNLSALSRSGIQFTDAQKKLINELANTNRLAEAQDVILGELEKQYGGSAAAAKAGTGPLKQLQNTLGDITEELGAVIAEGLMPLVAYMQGVAAQFSSLSPTTKKWIVVLGGIAAAIGPAILAIGTMVRNVQTLIPLMNSLKLAIASNPIGALAVAITAVGAALLVANSRLTSLTNAQEEFASITTKATGIIAKEKSELEQNLRVAKDDNRSKEDRLQAIKNLNALSPKYLGDLTLEKLNTDEARKAIEDYNTALLQRARVTAAQEKLVEVQKRLLDLQLGQADAVKPSLWQNLGNLMLSAGQGTQFAAQSTATMVANLNAETSELEKLQQQLTNLINGNSQYVQSNDDVAESLKAIASAKSLGELQQYLDSSTEIIKQAAVRRAEVIQAAIDAANAEPKKNLQTRVDVISEGPTAIDVPQGDLTDKVINYKYNVDAEAAVEQMLYFKEVAAEVSVAAAGAFENLTGRLVDSLGLAKDGFEGFVGGVAEVIVKLISMMLAQALAAAISGATLSGAATAAAAVVTTPTFIATAVSGVLAAFAAIPKFETGGIVGGSSFYGDKILARVNSGELILNTSQQAKLYNALQDGGSSGGVVGKVTIKGSDLQLALERTNNTKNRVG